MWVPHGAPGPQLAARWGGGRGGGGEVPCMERGRGRGLGNMQGNNAGK